MRCGDRAVRMDFPERHPGALLTALAISAVLLLVLAGASQARNHPGAAAQIVRTMDPAVAGPDTPRPVRILAVADRGSGLRAWMERAEE